MRGFISCPAHVRKALDRLRKVLDRFVRVAVLDAVAHAVLDVPLEYHLAAAVKCGFCGVDLRKNILTRHILVDHTVDGLDLTDDLFEPAMQIVRIHALLHCAPLHTGMGMIISPHVQNVNRAPPVSRKIVRTKLLPARLTSCTGFSSEKIHFLLKTVLHFLQFRAILCSRLKKANSRRSSRRRGPK